MCICARVYMRIYIRTYYQLRATAAREIEERAYRSFGWGKKETVSTRAVDAHARTYTRAHIYARTHRGQCLIKTKGRVFNSPNVYFV